MLYYPVDYDANVGTGIGFAESRAFTVTDCRFDREVDCTNKAGFFPSHPQVMPGVSGRIASNLGNRHGRRNVVCFIDGHVKTLANAATYKPDGSFSIWTISNTWTRPS